MLRLLNRATNLRKHSTRIRADQSHHAGDDHKNYSQHDGVFRDVLPLGLPPESVQMVVNDCLLGPASDPGRGVPTSKFSEFSPQESFSCLTAWSPT